MEKKKPTYEEVAHLIIREAHFSNNNMLYGIALSMIGRNRCVIHKLANGYDMNGNDIDHVIGLLASAEAAQEDVQENEQEGS